MKINIKEYTWWEVASSRKSAVKIIKEENIDYNNQNNYIIFDFDWIKSVSNWFIDELIWPYIEKIKKIPKNIEFKKCNNYIKKEITFIIKHRINKK